MSALRPSTGTLTVAALAALMGVAGALLSGPDRAAVIGLSQHGALVTAQDAGAADSVAAVAVSPGTAGQVLTVGDAGLPVWRAPADPITTIGDLATGGDAGTTRLAVGADGSVLTSLGGRAQWAAAGGSSSSTTLYADDCVAEAGSESASITGTGAASTLTLTASATGRVYGTSGATAARVVCALPTGTHAVDVEMQVTAISGMTTGGGRYVGAALRNAADGNAPSVLWGAAWNDNNTLYQGNLMSGLNGGTSSAVSPAINAVDRWGRLSLRPRVPFLSAMAGSGTSGARPTVWAPLATPAALITSVAVPTIADTESAAALAFILQSFGGGGATSITLSITVRVTL